MGVAWRYWYGVGLNGRGQCQKEEIPTAKAFFQQQFPQWTENSDVPDALIQRQFISIMRSEVTEDSETQTGAEFCLRCFISQQIEQTCSELTRRFGEKGGFKTIDLLPFVLDDVKLLQHFPSQTETDYESLADKILRTFNPERAQLSTWTAQLVKSNSELSRFLWECGVHIQSDWSILNNYQPKQLEKWLTEVYNYNLITAQRSAEILDSYQNVYLSDRIQRNRSHSRSRCQPPTPEQLSRILANLEEKNITGYTSDDLLEQLESLAELIRQSRQPKQEPLLDNHTPPKIVDETETEMQEFLQYYRQVLVTQLDHAIMQVLNNRINYLSRRKPPKNNQFIQALRLYCQGQPMSQIAGQVGLEKQYQVVRLLQLKQLRQDIGNQLLLTLKPEVMQLARYYTNLTKLEQLEQAVAAEVDRILEDSERETMSSNCSRESLFARRLYRHL